MTTYADAFPLSRGDRWTGSSATTWAPATTRPTRACRRCTAEDLSGLAPAVVVTAGFDPLVDQGEAYAERLKDAGVPVVYRCYDSLAHGFTAFTGAVPARRRRLPRDRRPGARRLRRPRYA